MAQGMLKSSFQRRVTSLPYSTKFETSDGLQYFRVIHDGQVKLCRMCLQPDTFLKIAPTLRVLNALSRDILQRIVKQKSALIARSVHKM